MPTYAPANNRKEISQIPAGTHLATCYTFLYVGTVPETYEGQAKETCKIRLTFELPNEMMVFNEERGEQPRVISEEYTMSLGDKARLRPIVEGMIGKKLTEAEAANFDLETLVGMSCLLSIVHKANGKGDLYARIASASPLMKGMEVPPMINAPRIQTYKNWDQAYFDKLPKFIQDKMKTSREYQKLLTSDGGVVPF